MKSKEDNETWISNIFVRNNFLCLKQVYCCLTFVCVYIYLFVVTVPYVEITTITAFSNAILVIILIILCYYNKDTDVS